MRAPPRLRGGLAARLSVLVAGLFFFAAGIVLMLGSKLGLSPWDVLHQGLAEQTPLSFGAANIIVSVAVLATARALGARVGVGTLANALLVGGFVQAMSSAGLVDAMTGTPLGVRIGFMSAGLAAIGLGSGLYLGAHLGAGPRDSLMLVGAERTRFRIGIVRAALEFGALAAGWALGGTVGVGTVAFALIIGPAIEASFWLLERSPLAVPGLAADPLGAEEGAQGR